MAQEKQMPPSASLVFLLCSLYREHSSLNNFAVRDEQASPVPALLRSLYHEPALTRFIACYAGCSFSNGTRKTNAAFGVACFSFVLIILQHFTSFVHCFPTRGTFYEKGSCKAGFSACGGSRKRHSSIPPQCDPRGAFIIVWKRSFLYDNKECALAHSRAEARLPRQPSTPAPSAYPRGAFLSYGNEVFYTIKNPTSTTEAA